MSDAECFKYVYITNCTHEVSQSVPMKLVFMYVWNIVSNKNPMAILTPNKQFRLQMNLHKNCFIRHFLTLVNIQIKCNIQTHLATDSVTED